MERLTEIPKHIVEMYKITPAKTGSGIMIGTEQTTIGIFDEYAVYKDGMEDIIIRSQGTNIVLNSNKRNVLITIYQLP